MEPAPERTLRRSGWYALVHDHGQTWAAVERIRLHERRHLPDRRHDRGVGARTRRLSRRRPRALGRRRRAGHARPRGRRGPDVEADPRAARLRAGVAVPAAGAPRYGLMFWLTWNR